MVKSQNGYIANDRSAVHSVQIPGGSVTVRKGPTGDLLAYFATKYHQNVEELVWPGNWGYAERPIRGSTTTLSNHASGTAVDLNAPKHPLGTDPGKSFLKPQLVMIRRLLQSCNGAIRWGGDYTGRKDPMHFEIVANEEFVAKVLKGLSVGESTPTKKNFLEKGDRGDSVLLLQQVLNDWYPKLEPLVEDGDFGQKTEDRVKYFQQRAGLDADGVVGPKTKAVLNI